MRRYAKDYRGDFYPCDTGEWVRYEDAQAIIHGLHATILALEAKNTATLSPEDMEWWDKLWNGYPKTSDYQGSIPISAKKPTMDRFRRNMAKHKVTSEQLVRAISDYVVDMKNKKNYLVSLHTLLGEQKAYWLEYLKREQP